VLQQGRQFYLTTFGSEYRMGSQTKQHIESEGTCQWAYAETHNYCRICGVARAVVDDLCLGCLKAQLMRRYHAKR